MVSVFVSEPLAPITVKLKFPAALAPALTVKTIALPAAVEVEASLAVTPLANPLTLSVTVPEKVPWAVTAIWLVPDCPAVSAMLDEVRLNDGSATTVKLIIADCVTPPPVAVSVAV